MHYILTVDSVDIHCGVELRAAEYCAGQASVAHTSHSAAMKAEIHHSIVRGSTATIYLLSRYLGHTDDHYSAVWDAYPTLRCRARQHLDLT